MGRNREFYLSPTEHKRSSRLLPFNEEGCPLGINGGGSDLVEALYGSVGKIAEEMFFPHRTVKTSSLNIQIVRGVHEVPP
jgi:hypothetical protein